MVPGLYRLLYPPLQSQNGPEPGGIPEGILLLPGPGNLPRHSRWDKSQLAIRGLVAQPLGNPLCNQQANSFQFELPPPTLARPGGVSKA
ncbi:hypothetical protein PoB_005771300 [Plakobranchus ocellatus]|uniref:Uncharacterized protein n=1 Tax=Plakobranchus ocellatus TaxID=259542 RepID=A0AAV4CGZ5_9GAST|nr:hypothetical protein PoB_005771300 [Plakobranchus ocellatus]